MLKMFYPSVYYASTYDIDFQEYYDKGFRGIIFDVDNTLVPHDADADERAKKLFRDLRAIGFDTCLTSNNKEERVKRFNQDIHSHYIYKANKPAKSGYQKAMEKMGTDKTNTLFVGDQLFTDIWGAKKAGIDTYLVKPIHPKEEIQIVLKRVLERIVLYFYHRKTAKKKKEQGNEQD